MKVLPFLVTPVILNSFINTYFEQEYLKYKLELKVVLPHKAFQSLLN